MTDYMIRIERKNKYLNRIINKLINLLNAEYNRVLNQCGKPKMVYINLNLKNGKTLYAAMDKHCVPGCTRIQLINKDLITIKNIVYNEHDTSPLMEIAKLIDDIGGGQRC